MLLRTSTCFMITVRFGATLSSMPQIVHWSVGKQISETVSPVVLGFCSWCTKSHAFCGEHETGPAGQGANGGGGRGGAARAAVIQPSLLEVQLSVLPIQQVPLLTPVSGPPSCHVRQFLSAQHAARQRSSVSTGSGGLLGFSGSMMGPCFVKLLQRPIFIGKTEAAHEGGPWGGPHGQ